jgi:hypothetical protein
MELRKNELRKYIDNQVKMILREEKLYNNNPIADESLSYLNEAFNQINNLDVIVDEIYDNLINKYKIVDTGKNFQQIKGIQTDNLSDTFDFTSAGYEMHGAIYENQTKIHSAYLKNTECFFTLFILNEEYFNNFSTFAKCNEFINANIKHQYSMDGGHTGKIIYLNIPAVKYKGNIFTNLRIAKNSIRHEITHYYQNILNPYLKTSSGAGKYYQHYTNIIKHLNVNNAEVRIITSCLYFFDMNEVTANANELTGQLYDFGVNRNNYKTVFNKTNVGQDYNNLINDVNGLFNSNTTDWEYIRKFMQNKKYFRDNSTLAKTTDINVFKKHLYEYIQKGKEYCWSKFLKSIEYAIGGYNGKQKDVKYTTKNQRYSGQLTVN